jgi:hypothetical protein
MQLFGQAGPNGPVLDGAQIPFRQGRYADQIVSELQGRFYEACYRSMLFSNGMSLTALTANTITLTATTTPILGLYNPATSPVNLVVLQASLAWVLNTFTTPATPGAFVWATSVGNPAVSTGTAGFSRKSLTSAGGFGKGMAFIALTGLTNNLVIAEGADLVSPGSVAYGTLPGTAIAPTGNGVQNFDGNLIVPPGGVLALLNTVSTTAVSVYGRMLWAEAQI